MLLGSSATDSQWGSRKYMFYYFFYEQFIEKIEMQGNLPAEPMGGNAPIYHRLTLKP